MKFLPNFWLDGRWNIGGYEKIWEGTPFGVIYCIFILNFFEIFGGRAHSYPPSPPLCLCASANFSVIGNSVFCWWQSGSG